MGRHLTEYNKEEADEILRRALEYQTVDELSHDELIEVATEIGLGQDDVERAARELREEQELEEQKGTILARRRRGFWGNFFTYSAVNGLLLMADLMQGPGWWVHWVAAGWGIFLVMAARPAFFPDRQKLERQAKRNLRRKRARSKIEAQQQTQSDLEVAIETGVSALVAAASRHMSDYDGRHKRRRGRGRRYKRYDSDHGYRVKVERDGDRDVIDVEVESDEQDHRSRRS